MAHTVAESDRMDLVGAPPNRVTEQIACLMFRTLLDGIFFLARQPQMGQSMKSPGECTNSESKGHPITTNHACTLRAGNWQVDRGRTYNPRMRDPTTQHLLRCVVPRVLVKNGRIVPT